MNLLLPILIDTYAIALPDGSRDEAGRIVAAAIERARVKHADFDRFMPGICFLASVVFTNHRSFPLDDYLETLYSTVKHGDFTKPWRAALKRAA